jgi:hypothetical protein
MAVKRLILQAIQHKMAVTVTREYLQILAVAVAVLLDILVLAVNTA